MIDDNELDQVKAALDPYVDVVDRMSTLIERLSQLLAAATDRIEVLELKDLHRQAADDAMMETRKAGCPDAQTSEQP